MMNQNLFKSAVALFLLTQAATPVSFAAGKANLINPIVENNFLATKAKARAKAFARRNILSPFVAVKQSTFAKPFINEGPRVRVSAQKLASILQNNEARRSGLESHAVTPQVKTVVGAEWAFDNSPVSFTADDYSDDLNQRYMTYYAPEGTNRIRVDFDWIDLENYDRVLVYDQYGLCASYSGNYATGAVSNECVGSYVDIWVDTDHSGSGSAYDGFYIKGFEYSNSASAPYPVAIAVASKYSALVGEGLVFSAEASYGSNANESLRYAWSFGDGTTSTAKTPNKLFSGSGVYQVQLAVTNAAGLVARDSMSILINQTSTNADFVLKQSNVSGDSQPVQVDLNKDSAEKFKMIDWGDGSVNLLSANYAKRQSHRYARSGSYDVVVKSVSPSGVDVKAQTLQVATAEDLPPSIQVLNQAALDKAAGKGYQFIPCLAITDDGSIAMSAIDWGVTDNLNAPESISLTKLDCKVGKVSGKAVKHIYRKTLANGRVGNLAGSFYATVTAVDNTSSVSQKSFVLTTKNVAPKVTGAVVTCNATTHLCATKINGSFATAVTDSDGTISDFRWQFFKADGVTPVEACADSSDATAQCQLPMGKGAYVIKAKATDNLGLQTNVVKKINFTK